MFERVKYEAAIKQVFLQAGVPAILTSLFIFVSFALPLVDSTRAPYFDLTQTFSQLAFWLSQSGGKIGATIVAVSMLTLLTIFSGFIFQRRIKEISIIVLIVAIGAGGGSALNEYIVKEQLKIPRPNIVFLAGKNGTGPLGMTPEEFYENANNEARRRQLEEVLNRKPSPVPLSSSIEAHWVETTGYSFPSGHSFSAMFLATFYLLIAATYVTTKRLWMFYALLPWALAVCYSRSILRVHTPADISVGGILGLAVGLVAWALARTLIRRLSP